MVEWNKNRYGKLKYSEKKCHFSYHKFHMIWDGTGQKLLWWKASCAMAYTKLTGTDMSDTETQYSLPKQTHSLNSSVSIVYMLCSIAKNYITEVRFTKCNSWLEEAFRVFLIMFQHSLKILRKIRNKMAGIFKIWLRYVNSFAFVYCFLWSQ